MTIQHEGSGGMEASAYNERNKLKISFMEKNLGWIMLVLFFSFMIWLAYTNK